MTITAGVSPQQTFSPNHVIIDRDNPQQEFIFDLARVKASYLLGVGAKYNFNPFFLAAEAQYNKRQYVYTVKSTVPVFPRADVTQEMNEEMNIINVPVSLGVDLGVVDITSGFVPQLIVSQQSDLENVEGYSQELDRLRFGWHSGIAANVKDFRIGVSWQMDFNNYADHAYINNQSLELQGRATRWLGTVTYLF
jgi:hypothetical protein